MDFESASLLIAGFATVLLMVTTVALDRTLFSMKAGYWTRFTVIGLRYGIAAFVIWSLFVILPRK